MKVFLAFFKINDKFHKVEGALVGQQLLISYLCELDELKKLDELEIFGADWRDMWKGSYWNVTERSSDLIRF